MTLALSCLCSLFPSVLNQDGQNGPSTISTDSTQIENDDMKSVLSLDDGRWSKLAEECASVPSVSLEEELSQLSIKQPSPPPVLAELERRPIAPSEVADPTPGLAVSETGRYQNLHVVSWDMHYPLKVETIILFWTYSFTLSTWVVFFYLHFICMYCYYWHNFNATFLLAGKVDGMFSKGCWGKH